MNIIENLEKEQMEKLTAGKNIPNFKPGDTLKVHTKVKVFASLAKTTV